MSADFINEAIQAALNGNWEKAVELNEKILRGDKKDVDALNRLGRAYMELGKLNKAREIFNLILHNIDPYNQIASKNQAKLKSACYKKKSMPAEKDLTLPHANLPSSFIEEPGRTKTVSLVNLASPTTLTTLCAGQTVYLEAKHHSIHISDSNGNYLGSLPDDIGKRLNTLVHAGNTYEACIRSASNNIVIFIREVSRAKKYYQVPSFSNGSCDHFEPPPEEVHEPAKTGEEEDEPLPPSISAIHQDEESEESQ